MGDLCTDNRFELIEKYKQKLIKCTNIESAPDEMAVLDNILFRFWQMGWLDKLDLPSIEWKKGKWIWDENGIDWGLGAWCCSKCGRKPETWWESDKRNNPLRCAGGRFCGNCGTDMR